VNKGKNSKRVKPNQKQREKEKECGNTKKVNRSKSPDDGFRGNWAVLATALVCSTTLGLEPSAS